MNKLEELKLKHKQLAANIVKQNIELRGIYNKIKEEEINNDFSIFVNKCFVVDIDDTLDYYRILSYEHGSTYFVCFITNYIINIDEGAEILERAYFNTIRCEEIFSDMFESIEEEVYIKENQLAIEQISSLINCKSNLNPFTI